MNFLFYFTNNVKSCFVVGKRFQRPKCVLNSRSIYLNLPLQLCFLYNKYSYFRCNFVANLLGQSTS